MDENGDLNIRSEAGFILNIPEADSTTPNRTPNGSEEIFLRTTSLNFPVSAVRLIECSNKIRKLCEVGKLPLALDLTSYDAGAIRWLVDYLRWEGKKDASPQVPMDESQVLELLELARVLEIHNLRLRIHATILKNLRIGTCVSLLLAVKVASSNWGFFLDTPIVGVALQMAVDKFAIISRPGFIEAFPAPFLVILLSRCNLPVSSEVQVCETIIAWLRGNERSTVADAQQLFFCVRSQFLTKADRKKITRKAASLPAEKKTSMERILCSARCQRCCVIESHLLAHFRRCGIPSDRLYAPVKPIKASFRHFRFDPHSATKHPVPHDCNTTETGSELNGKCYPVSDVRTAVEARDKTDTPDREGYSTDSSISTNSSPVHSSISSKSFISED